MSINGPFITSDNRKHRTGSNPHISAFSQTDHIRLNRTVNDAARAATAPVSSLIAPSRAHGTADSLTADHCVFDHCAVLLFPRSVAEGLRELEERGFAPTAPIPSTVVRRRVSVRYGIDPEHCDIHISRLHIDLPRRPRRRAVEVFLFPRSCAELNEHIEGSEVAYGFEEHTAMVVTRPDPGLLDALRTAWQRDAGLLWEGGGHNPQEGTGSTVMYFVRADPEPHRFELHCSGDFSAYTCGIPVDTEAVRGAYAAWGRDS